MRFNLEVTGLDGLSDQIETLMQNVPIATIKGLNEIGLLVSESARQSIQENQSSGRTYKVGKKEYTASAPGYPPNSQHGAAGFVGTIQFEVDEDDLSVWAGTNDQRGPWFEFSTIHMEARPWLWPAVVSNEDAISGILEDVLRAALE